MGRMAYAAEQAHGREAPQLQRLSRIMGKIAGKVASGLRVFFDVEGAASRRFYGYGGRQALNPDAPPDVGNALGNHTEEWMRPRLRRYATDDTPKEERA